jgi:hypothetical protein
VANGRYASITTGPPGWITVTFTYDEAAKNKLRAVAERGNFKWLPASKARLYRINLTDSVQQTLENFGFHIRVDPALQEHPPEFDCRQVWETIFQSIAEPLDRKVYRAAALALHPDQGGNTAAMQALNLAWESHEQQLGGA